MISFSSEDGIDCKFYEEEIGVHGFNVFVNPLTMNITCKEAEALMNAAYFELKRKCFLISQGTCPYCDPESVIEILINYCDVSPNSIPKTSRGKYSASMINTFEPLLLKAKKMETTKPLQSEAIIDLISAYIAFSKAKTYEESMRSKLGMMVMSKEIDYTGRQLCEIASTYQKQSTGRYYTKNDNLIGWSKRACFNFTVPKDYFLVWSDFGQIDLRVAMNLILFKGNPEMRRGDIEDKYEAFARAMYSKAGKTFDLERFKRNRPAYKQSILARMYGAGIQTLLGNGFTDREEVNELDAFFNKHTYYQEVRNKLENIIKFNQDITITDYFGEERLLDVVGMPHEHILKSAFNTPIQSTSNSILMLWASWIVKSFRSLGFNKDKFRPYLMRHDEGIFLCHKDTIPYLYIFKQASQIAIDDWEMLITDADVADGITDACSLGYNYKVTDNDLYEKYKQSVEMNKDKIIPFKKGSPRKKDYTPVKDVFYCYSLAPFSLARVIMNLLPNYPVILKELQDDYDDLVYDVRHNPDKADKLADLIKNFILINPSGLQVPEDLNYILTNYESNKSYYYVFYDNKRSVLERKNLSRFLKERGIGYVCVYNAVLDDYLVLNDIRWKFVKQNLTGLKNIINGE